MNDGLFFRPFVGSSYADGGLFGKRIMVLGESHYCDEGCADCGDCLRHRECMEFTNGVVKQYLDDRVERQRWMQTLLKFERSLVGRETDQALRQRIWQSVVYFCAIPPSRRGTVLHDGKIPARISHRMGQPPVGQASRRALDRWQGHHRGWLSRGNRDLYPGKRQTGEGDGCEPSVGGLFVGLLAQGDNGILGIKETI